MSGKKKLHEMKTTKWCITYWLTDGRSVEDLHHICQIMPDNWKLEGQIEQGHCKEGKLHAQLMLHTPQIRGTAVAKIFKECSIDEARNPFALQNYVHKEDTRVAEFKTIENRCPQWKEVVDKFFDWVIDDNPGYLSIIDDRDRLNTWDNFIGLSIEEGMRVDVIGVNPQYRCCISKYWNSYINFALRRQKDRQTNV